MSDSRADIDTALDRLRHSLITGRLAHAYVVAGELRGACRDVSLSLLKMLFCENSGEACGTCSGCARIESLTHPDLHWIEPEKKSRLIVRDQLDDLLPKMFKTSYEGGWKAVVISGADRMNATFANGFLKALEEPPAECMILLLTDSYESLLPTILSRCQFIDVRSAGDGVEQEWMEALVGILTEKGPDPLVERVVRSGQIDLLLKEIDEGIRERVVAQLEAQGEEVEKSVLDARVSSASKECRAHILRSMVMWYRDLLMIVTGADESVLHYPDRLSYLKEQAHGMNEAGLLKTIDAIEDLNASLDRNMPRSTTILNAARTF